MYGLKWSRSRNSHKFHKKIFLISNKKESKKHLLQTRSVKYKNVKTNFSCIFHTKVHSSFRIYISYYLGIILFAAITLYILFGQSILFGNISESCEV